MNNYLNKVLSNYSAFQQSEKDLLISINSLENYICSNDLTYEQLIEIKKQIPSFHASFTKLLDKLHKTLFKKCQHNWIIDRSDNNEHTQYVCTNCSLPHIHYFIN